MAQTNYDQQYLLRDDIGKIAVLTFNRPEARNSLSIEMMSALQNQLESIAVDQGIHAAILRANGPAFCAGHDLKEVVGNRRRAFYERMMNKCNKLMLTIKRLPQPVIAAVEGVASAAGCQLVATCDLAIASDKSRFALPGVNIGLWCSTPMVAVSRTVSQKAAMELLLTGDLISADEAERIGLVNRVVAHDSARQEAMSLAEKIASRSRMVVGLGKEAFYRQSEMELDDAYTYASEVMIHNLLKDDATEGISAFVGKRAPQWKNG